MKEQMNNYAELSGRIVTDPEFSHEYKGEKFYRIMVDSVRKSGTSDVIPVMVSETFGNINAGMYVLVNGRFSSYNRNTGTAGNRLVLYLFATEIIILDEEHIPVLDRNRVLYNGYLCRHPYFRVTPLGREVSDMLIAVHRNYEKSDYIPVIAWGRNARRVSDYDTGTRLIVEGRMQSRNYNKKQEDGSLMEMTAYEVSAGVIKIAGEADSNGEVHKEES